MLALKKNKGNKSERKQRNGSAQDDSQLLMSGSLLHLGETGNSVNGNKLAMTSVEDEEEEVKGGEAPIKRVTKLAQKMHRVKESSVKRISREDIRLVYTMEKVLGSGNFGTARLAHKTGIPAIKFAIKSI